MEQEQGAIVVERWIAFDVGKTEHHSTVLAADGSRLGARTVSADEASIDAWLERWQPQGRCAVVIDQPGSIGQLVLAAARRRGIAVGYVPGLVMRRAADLYPGQAKTDPLDSFVLADTARLHQHRLHWLDAVPDEALETLRVLCGYDEDLRCDANRAKNRLRDLLVAVCPPVERVLGPRLDHPAVQVLLARYPTPTALRAAGRARILRLVRPLAPRLADQFVTDLVSALDAQTLAVPAEAAQGRVIAELAASVADLHRRRAALADDVEAVFSVHPLARSSEACRESARGPAPGSWPRSVTSADSRPLRTSPPTPAWRPSPAAPAARSAARPAADAATTASRTPSS